MPNRLVHTKRYIRFQPTRFYDDSSKLNRSTLTLSEFKEASCNAAHAQEPASVVPIAPVRLRSGSRECEEPKYAMLNTCSTGSFVLEDIVDSLGIKGADTRLTEKTMNGRQFQDTKIQNGLVFSDLRGKNRVQLPKVFKSEDLSQREDLFSHKVVHKWKHLKSTADNLPPQIPGAKIGLFITQMHSQKDKKFLKIVSEGTRHTNDNHYEIPLPFHSEAP